MPEGMAGKAFRPSQAMDVPGEEKGVNRLVSAGLLGEEPVHGPAVSKPVLGGQVKGILRKDGTAVRTVLAMGDMYTHTLMVNIFTAETADFTDAQTGGIHDSDHGLLLEAGNGRDKVPGFILGREKGQVCVKAPCRELCVIPCLVKDINMEKPKL